VFVDAVEKNGTIYCWYRDEDNNLSLIEEPAEYSCYRRNEKAGEFLSMFGDTLSKQTFENRRGLEEYQMKYPELFESDIQPLYKFLSQTFYRTPDPHINVGFFDIEVDYDLRLGSGYPTPENPFGEITSISLYDANRDRYHMVMLNKDATFINLHFPEGLEVVVHWCVTERHLLDTFVRLIDNIDILSAWNGDMYDIPYIIERCCTIYGEKEGLKKLCRDGFSATFRTKVDNYGKEYVHYELVGRVHVDYMQIYKKYTFGERPSYALDAIAELELKENKLEYRGDLGDLYRTDPKTYFEYSFHDSHLLRMLDNKKKFINFIAAMCRQATMKFTDVLGSIKYLELSIMNHCHYDREQPIRLPDRKDSEKEKFPGAYVTETNPGAYGWTSSIDLEGLYPATIRSINISPETYMFQCMNRFDDFVKVVQCSDDPVNLYDVEADEVVQGYTGAEINEMLREHNLTISANGSIFKEELGLIPEVLALWRLQRKELKGKMFEHKKVGNKEKADYYDTMQNLKKLSMNSLYGAISNRWSRFYNIDLAASVTLSGQMIEKYQMWKADQIVQEKVANGN
jgi:DNA polymerase elongation subunit (family B)